MHSEGEYIYSNFQEQFKTNIEILIQNREWDKLIPIVIETPEKFSSLIVNITSFIERNPNLNPIEKNNKFGSFFVFLLNLIKQLPNIFPSEFLEKIHYLIYEKLDDKLSNEDYDLFIDSLGYITIDKKQDSLWLNRILLLKLLDKFPNSFASKFPQLVSICEQIGNFNLAYKLIAQYPQITKDFRNETIKVIQNLILNYRTVSKFDELLSRIDPQLIEIHNQARHERKDIFYKIIMSIDINNIKTEWFEHIYHINYFTENISLYSEKQLKEIVKKIIDLKIKYDNSQKTTNWVQNCLIELSWAGKEYLFADYINELIDLGYYQVIYEYFFKHDQDFEKIKIEKLKIDCYWLFELIKIKDKYFIEQIGIDNLFRFLITHDNNIQNVIDFFWRRYPQKIPEFNKIIVEIVEHIDFNKCILSNSKLCKPYELSFLHMLFEDNYLAIDLPIDLIQKKINQYLSNKDNTLYFITFGNRLFKYFKDYNEPIKNKIISKLIEERYFTPITTLSKISIESVKPYIHQILNIQEEDILTSSNYIHLLKNLIIGNLHNPEIRLKIEEKILSLPTSYEKGQLLSYLERHNDSANIFLELLKQIKSYAEGLNLFIDYQIELFELNLSSHNLESIMDKLILLKNILREYWFINIAEDRKLRFQFKCNYFNTRLYFRLGECKFNLGMYNEAETNFKEARLKFFEVLKTRYLSNQLRNDIQNYIKICETYIELSEIVKNYNSNKDILIQKSNDVVSRLLNDFNTDDIRWKKRVELLKTIFNHQNLSLTPFPFLKISVFCPIPPKIESSKLYDKNRNVIFSWDSNNKINCPNSSLIISHISQMFTLEIKFSNDVDTYNYRLNYSPSPVISIKIINNFQKPKISNILHFSFEIYALYPFYSDRELKFLINENTICNQQIILPLVICLDEKIIKNQSFNLFDSFSRISQNLDKIQDVFQKFLDDLIRSIDLIEQESSMKKLIKEKLFEESHFRDYIANQMESRNWVIRKEEDGLHKNRLDMRIKGHTTSFRITIECKIWRRNFKKNPPVSELIENMGLNDLKGLIFMVNPNQNPIIEQYKQELIFNEPHYVKDSFDQISGENRCYPLFKSQYRTNGKIVEIYHLIYDLNRFY